MIDCDETLSPPRRTYISRPAHLVTLIGLSECRTDVTWLNAGSNWRWLSAKPTGIDGQWRLLLLLIPRPVFAVLDEAERYSDLCRVYDQISRPAVLSQTFLHTIDSQKSPTFNRFAAVRIYVCQGVYVNIITYSRYQHRARIHESPRERNIEVISLLRAITYVFMLHHMTRFNGRCFRWFAVQPRLGR